MMNEIALINKFFYDHDVCVIVAARHPKTSKPTAIKTPGYIRYKLIPYAAGIEFADVFRLKTELDSMLANVRRDGTLQVRFDSVEFAVEVPRSDRVNLNFALSQLRPFTARVGRSYAFGEARDNFLSLVDSNSAHTLIAGMTGSGKSEMLRTVVADLLDNNPPAQLQALMIDLKNRGLRPFANGPHVLAYASEPEQATAILKWLHAEMKRRKDAGDVCEPRIVLFIDELAELASECGKAVIEGELPSLARMGRELGINIIATAQKPDSSLIGPQLKSQFGCKLIGLLDSSTTAFHITGRKRSGAESLPGKGAMLLIRDGVQPVRVQGYFVGERVAEVAAVVAAKHEVQRLQPIVLPPADEVAKLARKAKPVVEQYTRDGKLQRGGVGAVVVELFGRDARNEGHNNRMAQRVIKYLGGGMAHAN
jgi:hypothetical protein